MSIQCQVCGYPLGHINEACPICLPNFYRPSDPRDPHPTRIGIFRYHNCWKCRSGELPCVTKVAGNCGYPVARNC